MGLYDRDYMRERSYIDGLDVTRRPRVVRRRASGWWAVAVVVMALVGVTVLPRLRIDGRHWTLWVL